MFRVDDRHLTFRVIHICQECKRFTICQNNYSDSQSQICRPAKQGQVVLEVNKRNIYIYIYIIKTSGLFSFLFSYFLLFLFFVFLSFFLHNLNFCPWDTIFLHTINNKQPQSILVVEPCSKCLFRYA